MLTKLRKLTAVETEDGSGVRIRRLFPSPSLMNYDPFVLFDEFFLEPPAGFPLHPHRGFEAVTYLLEGGFHHRDTMGNDTTVMEGGVQRFSAGGGIEHAEMPGSAGMNHGIQLWVNLPKEAKKMPPDYQQVEPQQLPVQEDSAAIVKTVIGNGSPVKLNTGVVYLDIELKPGNTFEPVVGKGLRGIIYLIEGGMTAENEILIPGEALLLESGVTLSLHSEARSRFVMLTGAPSGEPIYQHGSFVD